MGVGDTSPLDLPVARTRNRATAEVPELGFVIRMRGPMCGLDDAGGRMATRLGGGLASVLTLLRFLRPAL